MFEWINWNVSNRIYTMDTNIKFQVIGESGWEILYLYINFIVKINNTSFDLYKYVLTYINICPFQMLFL